jgi:hypothetical protein
MKREKSSVRFNYEAGRDEIEKKAFFGRFKRKACLRYSVLSC